MTVHRIEIHRLTSDENIPGAVISKEGHADSSLHVHERLSQLISLENMLL